MMPTATGMSPMIPNHVLRVGQTIRLDTTQETAGERPTLSKPGLHHNEPDLDISLENLNQLILELDPTFEILQTNKSPSCIGSPSDSLSPEGDVSRCALVPRGCPPSSSPVAVRAVSPSIAIPTPQGLSFSPQGAVVFSSSPTSCLPPLPCGSAPRRTPTQRSDFRLSQGSQRLSHSNRNSAISLLSTSTCSDTSYILGSNLSLACEDSDSCDSILTPGFYIDESRTRNSPEKPPLMKRGQLQELQGRRAQISPAPFSGSLTDIPVLLVNGAPQPDLHTQLGPELDSTPTVRLSGVKSGCSGSFQARFHGSQPSMRFVMDTSKFWFRPLVSRAEAEVLIKDKESGAFVVRDSTSYRGSFGLVMKVDRTLTDACPGESTSDLFRHFLIESSPKGVRIKGSSQEPYFGSLSALVYQHTVSAYALPCRLVLLSQALGTTEEKNKEKATEEKNRTACNFVYLNAVPTEMLTGPCAVKKAVSSTLDKVMACLTPTIVNLKASLKGVTLTDINRKLFFRRHYPAHLLSFCGEDPERRLWMKSSVFSPRMFGFVAKGIEAGMENVCHVFAEYDPLQPYDNAIEVMQAAIAKL